MIDFNNGSVFKLSPARNEDIAPSVAPLIIPGEEVVSSFKGVRDFVVFTNKRLIAVNVQGMTGKKRDFTSLPYSKVQALGFPLGTLERPRATSGPKVAGRRSKAVAAAPEP